VTARRCDRSAICIYGRRYPHVTDSATWLQGILMALFLNTAGGAWDNAKKYIEQGAFGGKGAAKEPCNREKSPRKEPS
jgi:hypothetical protein